VSDALAPEVIAHNLALVRERVAAAARAAGRDPASVRLLAVSKTRPAAEVASALAAGQRLFGENYAQELRDKAEALGGPPPLSAGPIEWHFLGALQTNKARLVVGRAALVHTCDRLALAQELDKRARAAGLLQRVLVEVNIGREPQKGGCLPEETGGLLRALAALSGLRCEGLMCIPPAEGDPRPHFAALRGLREAALQNGWVPDRLPELSMGMSGDFEQAIAEGATLVRVGTAIFGPRARPA
jgi:pyridoxal phosphate enzyme (YggS family)